MTQDSNGDTDSWEPEVDREDCFNEGVCPICGREYDSPMLTKELSKGESYRMDVCILPDGNESGHGAVVLHAEDLTEKDTD